MPRRLHQKRFLVLHSFLLLHASIRHTSHLRLLSLLPVLLWRIRRISPPNLSKLPLALRVLDQAVIARAYQWSSLGWRNLWNKPPRMVCGPVYRLKARLLVRQRQRRRKHR
ncbi:hypothetical protein EV363DRAFT_1317963 [Boletus edulis]|nr:hypothetical protein EV363DRAFT_1317963 [Boletus edulis]